VTIKFKSSEEVNEKESVPTGSDIYDLYVYYKNADEDEKGVIEVSW
jgi:hypothetical protein